MKELMCFQKHFSQRATHLPGSGGVLRTGWLALWGRGRGSQLSAFPTKSPLTSETREAGGGTHRWPLAGLAWIIPAQRHQALEGKPRGGTGRLRGGLPVPFSQGPPPDERAAPDGFGCWNPPPAAVPALPSSQHSFWLVPVSPTPTCPWGKPPSPGEQER